MTTVPITRCLLRDGRMVTIRASRSQIKFWKRGDQVLELVFDDGVKRNIRAKDISNFIS